MPISLIELAERGWLPNAAIRAGIRRLLGRRLQDVATGFAADAGSQDQRMTTSQFAKQMRRSPMVVAASSANEQHYEVPTEFYEMVLGRHLKYSCGIWTRDTMSLDESEAAMLKLTCQRAAIEDGMDVLELGCGWGSLTLWIADQFSNCRVTAVSNSTTQRHFIEHQCELRGLRNVHVLTANVAAFQPEGTFDRVVSVEMFEHVRNYEILLHRIASWLRPEGKLFVHIFCHRLFAYPFEVAGQSDWMAKHFFTGGIMPSANLLREFSRDMFVAKQWEVSGLHYSRTCEAWLSKLDANAHQLRQLLAKDLSRRDAAIQLQRWRMFFMACSELFRYRGGREWGVGHYLLNPQRRFQVHGPVPFPCPSLSRS